MRRILRLTLPALAICFLAGNVAFAQGRGGRGGFQMGGPNMLGFEQVQKELKITDEQKAKITGIFEAARPPQGTNFQNLTDEERAEMRKKGEEAGKAAVATLTPEQAARFKQMQLWVQGSQALVDNADLAKELKLTDDQKGAVKTIVDESNKKIGELMRNSFQQGVSDDDRAKAREQMATLRNETDAECMAVLTDAQKSQLEKLKGPKFQLDMSQFGPRRGRGGQ
jgi:Spy/CpxP family protein refolding chaperone